MVKYYNSRVKKRGFKPGYLVLKKILEKTTAFEENWVGPFKIKDVVQTGTYHLVDLNGKPFAHSWNSEHLKLYYQ